MNDRIFELAEQAYDFADSDVAACVEPRIYRNVWQNKFAELIILDACRKLQETDSFCGGWAATVIEEHFGVNITQQLSKED